MNFDDKITYMILNTKLRTFSKNVNLILSNINNFERICSSALVLNDGTSYKSSVVDMKENLSNQKNKIDYQILAEIRKEISN